MEYWTSKDDSGTDVTKLDKCRQQEGHEMKGVVQELTHLRSHEIMPCLHNALLAEILTSAKHTRLHIQSGPRLVNEKCLVDLYSVGCNTICARRKRR